VGNLRQYEKIYIRKQQNNSMQYEEELTKYGLSQKEAKVYLSLLKLGPSTVNDVAEDADLVRTTTYDLLKALKEEGIVSTMVKNKVLNFEAAAPEKLLQILDERKKHVEAILSGLKKLRKQIPERPRSEIFEGKNGMKTVFQILLNSKKPLYAYSNVTRMLAAVQTFGPKFIKDRVKEKIPIKIITEPSIATSNLLTSKDKKELRETKLLPSFKNIMINQYMNDDLVAIFGSRANEPIGIVIYHKDYAQAQKIIFEELWKTLK